MVISVCHTCEILEIKKIYCYYSSNYIITLIRIIIARLMRADSGSNRFFLYISITVLILRHLQNTCNNVSYIYILCVCVCVCRTFIMAYFFINLSSPDVNAKFPFMHSALISATIRNTFILVHSSWKTNKKTIVILVYNLIMRCKRTIV
jgi:hypothetical protein